MKSYNKVQGDNCLIYLTHSQVEKNFICDITCVCMVHINMLTSSNFPLVVILLLGKVSICVSIRCNLMKRIYRSYWDSHKWSDMFWGLGGHWRAGPGLPELPWDANAVAGGWQTLSEHGLTPGGGQQSGANGVPDLRNGHQGFCDWLLVRINILSTTYFLSSLKVEWGHRHWQRRFLVLDSQPHPSLRSCLGSWQTIWIHWVKLPLLLWGLWIPRSRLW